MQQQARMTHLCLQLQQQQLLLAARQQQATARRIV
jgi:hypothetical protein